MHSWGQELSIVLCGQAEEVVNTTDANSFERNKIIVIYAFACSQHRNRRRHGQIKNEMGSRFPSRKICSTDSVTKFVFVNITISPYILSASYTYSLYVRS